MKEGLLNMNKKMMLKWLKERAEKLESDMTKGMLENIDNKEYNEGGLRVIEDLAIQIENGDFDNNEVKAKKEKSNHRKVVEQGYYRHFKGTWYVVEYVAKHTETEEDLVIYTEVCNRGKVYARPLKMFLSKVPKESNNITGQPYRFMLTTELGLSAHDALRETKVGIEKKLVDKISIWLVSDGYEWCIANEDKTTKEFDTIYQALDFLYESGYTDKDICNFEFRTNELVVLPVTLYTILAYKGTRVNK